MGTTAPKTFVERVIEFFQGGEEGKIKRFQTKALQFWKDQIDLSEREISDSKEKINDLKEQLQEAALSVDLEKIKEVGNIPSYIESYTSKLNTIQVQIDSEEVKISQSKKNIEKYKSFQSLINN